MSTSLYMLYLQYDTIIPSTWYLFVVFAPSISICTVEALIVNISLAIRQCAMIFNIDHS